MAGAGALAVLAGAGAFGVLQQMAPSERVVVYARPVQRLQTLTKEDLTVAELPARRLAPDTIRRVEDAVGRVTLAGGLPGDPVRRGAIAMPKVGEGPLVLKLEALHSGEEAKRVAFALPGSAAGGIASQLRPGDRVDVLSVMDLPPSPAGGQAPQPDRGSVPTSVMVVRGVPVLATQAPNENASGAAADGVVVLSLLPEEAERVALAVTRGRVFLALQPRNVDTTPVPPVQMPDLIAAR